MKKIISVVSIVFVFFLTINVYAIDECTTEEMNRLKELANNVEFKYDYEILDEFEDKKTLDVSYTFNIFNYDKDLKIYYQTEYSDEKIFLSNDDNDKKLSLYQEEKVDFYIYAYTTNLCTSELIKKTTITLPYYNTFYYFNKESCEETPNFKYCQEFLTKKEKSYDEIKVLYDEYKLNLENNKTKQSNNSFLWYIIGGSFLLILIIVIVFYLLKIYKRKKEEI